MKTTRRDFLGLIGAAIAGLAFVDLRRGFESERDAEAVVPWTHVLQAYDGDQRAMYLYIDGELRSAPCGHCGVSVHADDAELCWWCGEFLCSKCWDSIGHCGHPEAHQANYEASMVRQPDTPLCPGLLADLGSGLAISPWLRLR